MANNSLPRLASRANFLKKGINKCFAKKKQQQTNKKKNHVCIEKVFSKT